jgi:KipI family sensor histidine kinase inhibitor
MIPHYQLLSPTFGELVWDHHPTDELLGFQLAYLTYIQSNFSDTLAEARQGFTRISLVWKNPKNQQDFLAQLKDLKLPPMELYNAIWQVPVCYEPEYGQDLNSLAESKNLSLTELIQLHSEPVYRIHFFGFLPGFFYLNGLSPRLHTPRKSVPLLAVPPGSVAIGGSQTGIYPMQSPGGWHIIGRSPLTFFDSKQPIPVWAKPGEQIEFVPISAAQFQNWNEPYPKLLRI